MRDEGIYPRAWIVISLAGAASLVGGALNLKKPHEPRGMRLPVERFMYPDADPISIDAPVATVPKPPQTAYASRRLVRRGPYRHAASSGRSGRPTRTSSSPDR